MAQKSFTFQVQTASWTWKRRSSGCADSRAGLDIAALAAAAHQQIVDAGYAEEDARVEQLAIGCFPGLRRFWLPFHLAEASGVLTAPALMARLARALLDQ